MSARSRLSVYINDATALILLKYKMREQAATETTRQALAALIISRKPSRKGGQIRIVTRDRVEVATSISITKTQHNKSTPV